MPLFSHQCPQMQRRPFHPTLGRDTGAAPARVHSDQVNCCNCQFCVLTRRHLFFFMVISFLLSICFFGVYSMLILQSGHLGRGVRVSLHEGVLCVPPVRPVPLPQAGVLPEPQEQTPCCLVPGRVWPMGSLKGAQEERGRWARHSLLPPALQGISRCFCIPPTPLQAPNSVQLLLPRFQECPGLRPSAQQGGNAGPTRLVTVLPSGVPAHCCASQVSSVTRV